MEIERTQYIRQLIGQKGNGRIKVITGIRRCGKSYLLNTLFYRHLVASGVPDDHIIRFAFDSAADLEKIGEDLISMSRAKRKADPHKFLAYIRGKVKDQATYYLLLDEVQELEAFEAVLNGYLREENLDIYVTGSNSRFLSRDVVTEFRDRGNEIHVMPLSFSEYLGFVGGDAEKRLEEYMVFGGLPGVVLEPSPEEKMRELQNLLQNTYLKDILERNGIRKEKGISDLLDVIASGIACPTNPSKLSRSFASAGYGNMSDDTVRDYIGYFEEAFLLKKVLRFDIKGKKYINTPYKVYFEDLGIRNSRLGFRQIEYTHLTENVIYNELRFREYSVDVGMVEIREKNTDGEEVKKQLECDFIANRGTARYYIQAAWDISDAEKLQQETRSLDAIGDSCKKVIVVGSPIVPRHTEKGYLFISLADFLQHRESLDW